MKIKNTPTDHTLIINELERSIKFYGWDFILPFLPKESFLVGGYIRDLVLGRMTSEIDVDIVVPKNSINIGKKIADTHKGKFVILDKEREVVRIIFNHISIDLANQTSSTIIEDLMSRDFSINAIAFLFNDHTLIDPLNGLKDIEFSLIRTYDHKNLLADPLRILRCFRFVSELNFNIEKQLSIFINQNKKKLNLAAKERINYEIQRIVRGENATHSILLIQKIDLFDFKKSKEDNFFIDLNDIKFKEFNQNEEKQFLPLFFLSQILDELTMEKFGLNKAEIINIRLLRKWQLFLRIKGIYTLDEIERFNLHKELENILPAFIFYLPQELRKEWMCRWRDKNDKLFHPSNLVNGDILKKLLIVHEGPMIGDLLNYLSIELAYKRLNNFDEAIFKAKQWIKQNAPKCD